MTMDGPWQETVNEPENRYLYNGKELNSDFGLDWLDYGARWYDASIARFSSIDPLAEDYYFQSPYVYGANNPIKFIDYLGLGPIYGPDGKLIGYEVEKGQGPTQIAQDLNENYSHQLKEEVSWIGIVRSNITEFTNVANGEGEIADKSNEDYKSGNLEPGDILKIKGGIEVGEIAKNKNAIDKIEKTSDSLQDVASGLQNDIEISQTINEDMPDFPDEPRGGLGLGVGFRNGLKELKIRKIDKKVNKLENKADSLREVNDKLKGNK